MRLRRLILRRLCLYHRVLDLMGCMRAPIRVRSCRVTSRVLVGLMVRPRRPMLRRCRRVRPVVRCRLLTRGVLPLAARLLMNRLRFVRRRVLRLLMLLLSRRLCCLIFILRCMRNLRLNSLGSRLFLLCSCLRWRPRLGPVRGWLVLFVCSRLLLVRRRRRILGTLYVCLVRVLSLKVRNG